jgi:uncharacterized membrane-anchored protein YhcB (DUF1043 family)
MEFLLQQWPLWAAGAVILSALIMRRNYYLQIKTSSRLQTENEKLKLELDLLRKQIDDLHDKLSKHDGNLLDNSIIRDLQNVRMNINFTFTVVGSGCQ